MDVPKLNGCPETHPETQCLPKLNVPDATQSRSKPTVVGDDILVGDQFGNVYAIEAASGCVRAHATADGSLLWEYDTTGDHETVNGIAGHGGAIDGPAPVIVGGLVFVNSGYGMFGQMPGNVLLAFGVNDQ